MGNLGSGSVLGKNGGKEEKLSFLSIDFMGLNFSDKKMGRGLPAGLVPPSDPFPVGDLPEVEIIVGDLTKFDEPTVSPAKPKEEDNPDLYKPKVSTWGVFPRPGNISKTVLLISTLFFIFLLGYSFQLIFSRKCSWLTLLVLFLAKFVQNNSRMWT